MPHDYYIWIETVIQYIDAAGFLQCIIEGEKPKRKYNKEPTDYDFEVAYGLNDEIRDYDRKILFQNGVWLANQYGKLRIQRICYKNRIPLDSIISVFKFKNGYLNNVKYLTSSSINVKYLLANK